MTTTVMGYEEQLKTVWLVFVYKKVNDDENKLSETGSAFCFRCDGHLITTRHVVGTKDDPDRAGIMVRTEKGKFRVAQYVHEFPYLDMAILKVVVGGSSPTDSNVENFDHLTLNDHSLKLVEGEKLVSHGHGNTPFSSMFGNSSFHYQPSTDLDTLLADLSLSMMNFDDSKLSRQSFPRPTDFWTVSKVLRVPKDGRTSSIFHQLHPDLPVIIDDGSTSTYGFSGSPLFRDADGQLLGMVIGGMDTFGISVPLDVICFAIRRWLAAQQDEGFTS